MSSCRHIWEKKKERKRKRKQVDGGHGGAAARSSPQWMRPSYVPVRMRCVAPRSRKFQRKHTEKLFARRAREGRRKSTKKQKYSGGETPPIPPSLLSNPLSPPQALFFSPAAGLAQLAAVAAVHQASPLPAEPFSRAFPLGQSGLSLCRSAC